MQRILVLDDDRDLLEMVGAVLSKPGTELCLLSNSTDFFASLESFRPHLVLLDIFLGEDDGRELCRKIKQDEHLKHIPVILYSAGFITSASIEASLADDFIVKPFDLRQLMQKVYHLAG